MINYALSLTIPPGTNMAEPEVSRVKLTLGMLSQIYIHGAPEHQHQTQIAVYLHGHRIFPEGEVEVFYPSEYPATFMMSIPLTEGATELEVRGANADDTYEHSVYLVFSVSPFSSLAPTKVY